MATTLLEEQPGSQLPIEQTERGTPCLVELGVWILVVAVPLAFLPMSAGPFVDVKAHLVAVGCFLIWLGNPRIDRRLGLVALVWAVVVVLASVTGTDRWFSLAGQDNKANGLILLLPCAYLVVVGSSLPERLVAKIPGWLFATSAAVASIAVAFHFWPEAFQTAIPNLSFIGSTLGNTVFLSGMTAVGLVAASAVRTRWPVWWVLGLVAVSSALSIAGRRVGWVGVGLGLLILLRRAAPERRRVLVLGGVVGTTLIAWTLVGILTSSASSLSAAPRFGSEGSESIQERLVTWRVMTRAAVDRPLLGWGPASGWGAYVSHATVADFEEGVRGYSDAHDLLVESGVSTGLLGLAALVALAALLTSRMRRSPAERSWAVAAVAVLAFLHLAQPVSSSLTPLLFLFGGVAASNRAGGSLDRSPGRLGRAASGVALGLVVVVTLLSLTGSVLEQWGRTYNSIWSLRVSHVLAPWRVSSVKTLSYYLAEDGDAGFEDSAREARNLAEGLVATHPWYPDARFIASDVYRIMRDLPRSRYWLQQQLRVFPADRQWLPAGALEFARTGQLPGGFPGVEQQADRSG